MNNSKIKFRIYSFTDKIFHYFDIYEGYPSGIYGGVSEPSQFTGFLDRNGKEVYIGDIVSINSDGQSDAQDNFSNPTIAEVLWEQDAGGYIVKWKGNPRNQNYENFTCDVAFFATIIGNIFENPEFLK